MILMYNKHAANKQLIHDKCTQIHYWKIPVQTDTLPVHYRHNSNTFSMHDHHNTNSIPIQTNANAISI